MFPGQHQTTCALYCPACAIERRNEGKRVATFGWKLCSTHLARLAAMLHDPYPDSDVLLYWAHYAKAKPAFISPFREEQSS